MGKTRPHIWFRVVGAGFIPARASVIRESHMYTIENTMKDPYRNIARFYDAVVEPFNATLRRYVVKVARPTEGMKVLEIGCGTGTNLELFADAGCDVAGVDLSPSMIDLAKKKLGDRADLRLGDASKMPFADGSFDLVISFLTLHEMPPAVRAPVMNEMVRVAGTEGELLLIDYSSGPYQFPKGWFYRSVILAIEFGAGWEHFQNHRDFLARKGLPALMSDNGLSVTRERILAGGNIHVVLATPDTT
jgi:ubiquinone/menaquinone biosynthesis C-methylase UbiE